jgi:hypothetical protein
MEGDFDMTKTLMDALWQLGTLVELPRDMHCAHELAEKEGAVRSSSVPCPECRQVLEVMEALRNERPS